MTDEQLKKFKESVYEPYNEAWKIMQTLKQADINSQKFWDEYTKKATEFPNKYGNSEISQSISRVLLDAGSEVSKIGR